MRTWECVRANWWVCTHASKHVGTCILLRYGTNAEYWLVSVTFVGSLSLSLHLRLYSHHSPSPYPPLLPSDQHPPCPLSQLKTIWLGLPPSIIMGARWRNLRLARDSAESVCLRAHCYLHHAPPRPHTRPRTLTTPLYATTLHTSLPRAPCPHPCTP